MRPRSPATGGREGPPRRPVPYGIYAGLALAATLHAGALAAGIAPALQAQAPAAERSAPVPSVDEVRAYVDRARDEWGVPGTSVAVVHGDSVFLAEGFGVRQRGADDPVDEHTLFAIGSTSKAFTSASLGILVDEGRLDWDDRAVDHLPGFRLHDDYVTGALTLRDLLSHTSGLPRGDRTWYASEHDRGEVLHRLRHLEPNRGFREGYGYQNIMFLAAGRVVREATGVSWDDFLRERIFDPLGMDRTGTSVRELDGLGNVAAPHERDPDDPLAEDDGGDPVRAVEWRDIDNIGPAGSINSSALEMAEWLRLHLNKGEHGGERILGEETVREIFTPNVVVPRGEDREELFPETNLRSYGLAWMLRDYRGHRLIGHGGAIDGMRAEVALVPERDLGIVVLSNLGGTSFPTAVVHGILDHFIGPRDKDWVRVLLKDEEESLAEGMERRREREERRVEGTSPSLPPEGYAGRYDDPLYGSLEIEADGEGLVVRRGPHVVGDARHWHFDTFRVDWRDPALGADDFLTFTLGPDGRVEAADLDSYGTFVPVDDPEEPDR